MKKTWALLAVIVLCLALAAGIAYWKCDWPVVSFFLRSGTPRKAPWLLAIGEFGRPLAPFWLLLLWAWAAKRPRVLLAGLLAMLLTLGTVLPIKSAVGRVRPDEEPTQVRLQPFYERSYSFPSGDATLAFAVATVTAGFIASAYLRWLPFPLAAMAGVTRLVLFRHFASDVIAGAALGILCGCAALRLSRSAFARRALSRVPPTCWRPAFGSAALLYLISDLITRGPVLKNFLPVFWPAVVFVLIAAKGPALLRRIGWPPARRPLKLAERIGVVFWYVTCALMCVLCLYMAVCGMSVTHRWPWFLPAAAVALVGLCWAAPAMWRGRPGRALCRLAASSVLSYGLSLEAIKVILSIHGH